MKKRMGNLVFSFFGGCIAVARRLDGVVRPRRVAGVAAMPRRLDAVDAGRMRVYACSFADGVVRGWDVRHAIVGGRVITQR
jgi:hypothetical protein